MDHDPTIRELLLDLLSEDQKTVIQAGKKLSDLWSGHKDDSPDFDGSLFDKSTTAFDKAVHRILHSEGFPSEALLRKCLMLYVDGQNRRVGYLNGSDWICDPDWDGLTLGSITGTILMQAGSAAASIKDEILDVMDVTVGDPNGLSSTSHLDLACWMLSQMGPDGASAFDKVLDISIQDQGALEIKAVIHYCENDPRNAGKLIKRLREVSDDDTEAHILQILGSVSKNIPETRSIVIPELTSRIKHPCIRIVANVIDTLLYLDAFDSSMEETIRHRRESEKDSECDGYSRKPPEDFGLPDSPLDRNKLMALLKADDPYDRAFAAEKLKTFAQEPDVVSALIETLNDEEVVDDFEPPCIYALRSLTYSGKFAKPAKDKAIEWLKSEFDAGKKAWEQNRYSETNGIVFGAETFYDVADIAKLIGTIGKPAADARPLLVEFERFLTIHDVYGEDTRVEAIRDALDRI